MINTNDLRTSISKGAISAVYERLLEGEDLQLWWDGETTAEWNGPEVEAACREAYQEVKQAMEQWAMEVSR